MRVADRTGKILDEPWVRLGEDAGVPISGNVIVSFARLKNEHNALFATAAAVGVEIPSDVVLDELLPFLPRLNLIVVRFASMRDGRPFSVGRLLRERYGYTKDLRAVGDFIPDQVLFLLRCGFSTFEINPTFSPDTMQRCVAAYTAWYQHAGDCVATVVDQRHNISPRKS